jgi:hypothetical protein
VISYVPLKSLSPNHSHDSCQNNAHLNSSFFTLSTLSSLFYKQIAQIYTSRKPHNQSIKSFLLSISTYTKSHFLTLHTSPSTLLHFSISKPFLLIDSHRTTASTRRHHGNQATNTGNGRGTSLQLVVGWIDSG